MHPRVPYGPRRRAVVTLLSLPLIFSAYTVTDKLAGNDDHAWASLALLSLSLAYAFGAFAAFLFASPGRHGSPVGGKVVLKIPTWRRVLFATMLPGFFAIADLDVVLRGEAPLDVVAALAGVAAVCLAVTTERVAFSDEGIQRLSGLGARHRIAWGDISNLEVSPASMVIHGQPGKKIPVTGLWLDGYAELVVAVLERAPKQVLHALDEERREQLLCIGELMDPAAAARHRAAFQGG